MKLFLTGGTGFVGSHFINAAHAAGHEIVALRRPGSLPRVALARQPRWVEGALDGDYKDALRGCDVLVHLASHTPNPPYDSLLNCLYWNVQASVALAEQAREVGLRRYLVAGSCFEYGRAAALYERIPVSAPLAPTLSYPTSKAAASVAFQGFAAQHQVYLKLYRIFQVYGEGEQDTRLWPSLKAAALRGADFPMTAGEQVRDFINVADVAAAFVAGLDFDTSVAGQPEIRHIASGQPQTLLAFSQHWWEHWNAKGVLRPGAVEYRPQELMRLVPEVSQ